MKLGPDDFAGAWRIRRKITDFRMGASGALDGQATFTADGTTLHYHEQGLLTFAGGAPIQAERRYLWTFSGSDVFVAYDDGSAFHSFHLAPMAEATPHLCGEDWYKGTYDFAAFPRWQVTWTVTGPRKNYTSVTTYHRP